MRRLLGSLNHLFILEAALIGVFFVQALRFLIGTLYARTASASLFPALDPNLIDPTIPGLVEPSTVSGEISFLVYMLALPLLTALIGRVNWLLFLAAIITAVGRYLMLGPIDGFSPAIGASIAVGGGLMYIAMVIRHRARALPYLFVLALAIDQIFRAFGNTLDPSWSENYIATQLILSLVAIVLSFYTIIRQNQEGDDEDKQAVISNRGLLTFWSGFGLGGLLFLELSLLTLPNAIIGRAGYSSYAPYPILVPFLIVVTLLPLIPWIRAQAASFIGIFDNNVRGWVWMLIIALLVVVGVRLGGVISLVALVIAQFFVSLVWWWLARPQAEKERNLSGLWIILAALVFALLTVFDIFTYEYAFVRDFAPELNFLNPIIPPLLRGFRGLGIAVILLSVVIAVMPMIQSRRRIPWIGGSLTRSALALGMIVIAALVSAFAARPPQIRGINNPEEIRIGTYNIHAGFSEFYSYDLQAIADTIALSGVDVLLLQEIETGRMTSFGVDQVLWLARSVDMDARFYATNEGLQGLAVLSRAEIVFDDGALLGSVGTQTGLQRVQVRPDENVITLYNTWLGVLLETDSERTIVEQEIDQQAQLNEIFTIIAAQNPGDQLGRSRTVIGGTFNNVPDSDLIARMRNAGFVDPFAGLSPQIANTYVRTGQSARLDYLWLTPGLPAFGALTIDSNASDHLLAFVGVELR